MKLKQEIYFQLVQQGIKKADIALKFGVSRQAVNNVLRRRERRMARLEGQKIPDFPKLYFTILRRIGEVKKNRLPEQYLFALLDMKKQAEIINPLSKLFSSDLPDKKG